MAPLNLKGIFLPALISAVLRSRTDVVKETPIGDEYDYIVVGSGWAGSIVSTRLSKDPDTKVLLLEAGAKDNTSAEIPLLSLALHGGDYDWKYKTTPQKDACWGNLEKRCNVPAGKVAGGSSNLGFTMYMRGRKEEYDDMGENNPGWSYKDLLPFMKQTEDYHMKGDCVEDTYHGCNGELYIGELPEGALGNTTDYFIEGAKEVLNADLVDFNAGDTPLGICSGQYFMRDGVKWTANNAFLKRYSKERSNLHISLNTLVLKVLIDPDTKKATGVEYEKDGVVKTVKAKKEVILSAGAYASPKLLMLSGIGPKEELEKFKIPVIADVPGVGQNYIDILSTVVVFVTGKEMSTEQQSIVSTKTIREWGNAKGILNTPTGFDAFAHARTKYAEPRENIPDLLLAYQSLEMHAIFVPFLQKALGFTDKYWDQFFMPLVNQQITNIQPTFLAKNSPGYITLSSSDPHEPPIIEPNYYADKKDLELLKEGIRTARKFVDTAAFKEKGYYLYNGTFDECKAFSDQESDEYLECFLKYATVSKWAGCCTDKMGPEDDKMAVVDNRLRVRGVSSLRIIDGSVMIKPVTGLPGATIMAIAEKGADMIISDNK